MNIWKTIMKCLFVQPIKDSELMAAFRNTADMEFSQYLEMLLKEEKETIVSRTGETWFYTLVYDYILGCDSINEMILDSVNTEYPIREMWEYCSIQELNIADWDDVAMIMEETFLLQNEDKAAS